MSQDEPISVFGYEELCQRCLDNVALVERVLDVFVDSFTIDIEQLEKQLAMCRWDQAGRLAHRMKGAAGNASAPQLHRLAGQLERSLSEQRVDGLSAQLAELRSAWRQFLDEAHPPRARTSPHCSQEVGRNEQPKALPELRSLSRRFEQELR